MIVLDYLKETEDGRIRVPPFHTGTLGLVPDTHVNVYLVPPQHGDPDHCDVVIAPFLAFSGDMCSLTCKMKDEVGVVSRLMEAVNAYRINVITQESTSIDRQDHHFVHLMLDWSTSHFVESPSRWPKIDRSRYQKYSGNLDLSCDRQILLFESIIARCGDVILEDRTAANEFVPALYLKSVPSVTRRQNFGSSKVVSSSRQAKKPRTARSSRNSFHVDIKLPESILSGLRSVLQRPSGELGYILFSDTESRLLRVFFPRPGLQRRLVHVGLSHIDVPGALAAIMDVLQESKVNILTSLLRKQSLDRSYWEAILEFPEGRLGLDVMASRPGARAEVTQDERSGKLENRNRQKGRKLERLRLVRDFIAEAATEEDESGALRIQSRYRKLLDAQVRVVPPAYPKRVARKREALAGREEGKGDPMDPLEELAKRPAANASKSAVREQMPEEGFLVVDHSKVKVIEEPRNSGVPYEPLREERDRKRGLIGSLWSEVEDGKGAEFGTHEVEFRRDLVGNVNARVRDVKPAIFLSYSRTAQAHGKTLKTRLSERGFEVIDYQRPDGEVIMEKVIAEIGKCRYFIGIWHHEDHRKMGDGLSLSPWMPFEYGIASALGKKSIILRSDRLDSQLWSRIDAGISRPEYSDITFMSDTIPLILSYCESNFRE